MLYTAGKIEIVGEVPKEFSVRYFDSGCSYQEYPDNRLTIALLKELHIDTKKLIEYSMILRGNEGVARLGWHYDINGNSPITADDVIYIGHIGKGPGTQLLLKGEIVDTSEVTRMRIRSAKTMSLKAGLLYKIPGNTIHRTNPRSQCPRVLVRACSRTGN